MITIDDGLIAFLNATAGVTNLVSTRIYKNKLPQTTTMPAITVQRISTPRVHTHDTSGATGTAYPRFQIDAWGASYTSCKTVTDAIRTALNGYKGTMGSVNPVTVQSALIQDETFDDSPDTGLMRIISDYVVWHLEG